MNKHTEVPGLREIMRDLIAVVKIQWANGNYYIKHNMYVNVYNVKQK